MCSLSPEQLQITALAALSYLLLSSCYSRFGVCECLYLCPFQSVFLCGFCNFYCQHRPVAAFVEARVSPDLQTGPLYTRVVSHSLVHILD